MKIDSFPIVFVQIKCYNIEKYLIKEEHMGEKRYIISDAAKMVDVESHVLRYWEDELDIIIPRNEMGHRYYTDFHINLLKNVKELKDCGYQLKAIKMLIPELVDMPNHEADNLGLLKEELFNKIAGTDKEVPPANAIQVDITLDRDKELEEEYAENKESNSDVVTVQPTFETGSGYIAKGSKLEQFQLILSEVVSNALKENTGELGKEVSEIVSDNVIKEMDYLMHIREKQEEERFKKLDETIRNYQSSRKEYAKNSSKLLAKLKRL
jgi:DNA-binding transcriptional MerR regulator